MALKKYSEIQIGALATAFKKSSQTIKRWIKSNNYLLQSDKARATLLKLKSK